MGGWADGRMGGWADRRCNNTIRPAEKWLSLCRPCSLSSFMQPHERLIAWQRAHAFVLEIHKVTKAWPSEERYGLVSQVRRAAFSVAVNIVEGCARRGRREFRRFLDISYASLAETGYILLLARDLGYLTKEDRDRLEGQRCGIGAPLFKLMRAMDQDP